MCMLELLFELSEELGFKVVAAHLNHGLRGTDADNDELLCKGFCKKRNIEFFSRRVDIKAEAKQNGCGEEEAGRKARYAFFEEVAGKYKNSLIATAHTKNDLAETVLHRVIRGSSVKGLAAIRPRRDNIIRPILCLTREQVEKICEDKNLQFATDKTNFETIYTRNKIRLDIIPRLKSINGAVLDSLSAIADISAADSDFLEKVADAEFEKIVRRDNEKVYAQLSDILNLDTAIRARVIIKMAQSCGAKLQYRHVLMIDSMCRLLQTGKSCDIPGGYAKISYGKLEFWPQKQTAPDEFYIKAVSGKPILVGDYEVLVEILDKNLAETAKIVIRSRKDGDKVIVNSMTKKLKKVFIDLKVPQNKRGGIPIVEINNEIYCAGNILKSDALINSKDKIRVTVKLKQHTNKETN